ncbi:hypothetical protein [Niabella hirudinis]|uniref:hypothetical protein n=1 Tax=Niabella hirudinis TaxID=1285929 RepID=UPI003EBB2BAE
MKKYNRMRLAPKLAVTGLFALLFVLAGMAGCSKNSDSKDNNNPAKYDKSSLGSYSGVLVGSSGYITIDLKPAGASATIVFDDITYQLSSSVAIPAGTNVSGYTLQKDGVKIVMNVNADGSVPQVAVTIPGHDVTAVIFKVTSAVAVENYTGTFSGTDAASPEYNNSGTLNFTISGNNVTLLSKCISGNCDDHTTVTMTGKVTRSGENFVINFNDCNSGNTICTLSFIKNAAGYKAVVPIDAGVQLAVTVKKVP